MLCVCVVLCCVVLCCVCCALCVVCVVCVCVVCCVVCCVVLCVCVVIGGWRGLRQGWKTHTAIKTRKLYTYLKRMYSDSCFVRIDLNRGPPQGSGGNKYIDEAPRAPEWKDSQYDLFIIKHLTGSTNFAVTPDNAMCSGSQQLATAGVAT